MKIKLNIETAKGICFDDYLPEGYEIIEDGNWISEGKYEYKEVIFKFNDKFYSTGFSRSGSHYTDWYYDWEGNDNYTQEAVEVEQVEVVKHEWVVVKD